MADYKISFDYKPLHIVSDTSAVESYLHNPAVIFIDELNENAVKTMIQELGSDNIDAGVFHYSDTDAVVQSFKEQMQLIVAAGGMVQNEKVEILLIFRRGKWDLPKGKLDQGEELESCAIREVEEETGIKNVELKQKLFTSYHAYHENQLHILKETHWYLMNTKNQKLTPQTDEDIQECRWVAIDELENYLSNTYAIIRDVVDTGLKAINRP